MSAGSYTVEWSDCSGIHERRATYRGTLAECVRWSGALPHVDGPNGPVTGSILYRPDGSRVHGWATELESAGLEALVTKGHYGRERIVDSRDLVTAMSASTHSPPSAGRKITW